MSEHCPGLRSPGRPKFQTKVSKQYESFFAKKTSTTISITCTNLRGLGITVDELADKKINRILNLTAEIHILIDTRCDEENFKNFLTPNKFKYVLSNFKHIGSYTQIKGNYCVIQQQKSKN